MKRTIIYNLLIVLLTFCFASCSDYSEANISQKPLATKLHLSKANKRITPKTSFVIYDHIEAQVGLNKAVISLDLPSGDTKKDVVQAFLKHNHILNTDNQLTLLKIEEVGAYTNIYLSPFHDLVKPSTRKLFNKALELTILRHLKSSDFNIIYNETAQLLN